MGEIKYCRKVINTKIKHNQFVGWTFKQDACLFLTQKTAKNEKNVSNNVT